MPSAKTLRISQTAQNANRLLRPTLVLVTGEDHVHPVPYGERLAALIPLTSKGRDTAAHVAEFRASLLTCLRASP